jgi:hypothetical protein
LYTLGTMAHRCFGAQAVPAHPYFSTRGKKSTATGVVEARLLPDRTGHLYMSRARQKSGFAQGTELRYNSIGSARSPEGRHYAEDLWSM